MNVERMLAVAGAIEKDGLRDRNVKFNMGAFLADLDGFDANPQVYWPEMEVTQRYDCGMVACIGGHACLMYGAVGSDINDMRAGIILGLDEQQTGRLFFNEDGYVSQSEMYEITREEAVAAIRRMVAEEGPAPEPIKVEEPELVCA